MTYKEFFDNNIKHPKRDVYCVFPNFSAQRYWTSKLAQERRCISIDNYITFRRVQLLLQHLVFRDISYKSRLLTRQESLLIVRLVIQDKEAQALICALEQAKNTEISHGYADKLYSLLCDYSLHAHRIEGVSKDYSKDYIHILAKLNTIYNKFLEKYNALDIIRLANILDGGKLKSDKISLDPNFHLQLFFPDLYEPEHLMWLELFGVELNQDDSHSKKSYFSYEYIRLELLEQQQLNLIDFSTQALYSYPNIGIELESICCNIKKLIDEHSIAPQDIMISICQSDDYILSELSLLAEKYSIPMELQESNDTNFPEVRILHLLRECMQHNFSPNSLQALFFEPTMDWNKRNTQIKLVSIGLECVAINDKSLSRWKHILKDHKKLLDYFEKFSLSVSNIKSAKSFVQLYQSLAEFFVYFSKSKVRALGVYDIADETQEISVGNNILKAIEPYMSFEKYLQSIELNRTLDFVGDNGRVWDLFVSQYSLARNTSRKYNRVRVSNFPQSLGTDYKFHFVCNLSQRGLLNVCSYKSRFNDFLAKTYDNHAVVEAYNTYFSSVRNYLSRCTIKSCAIEGMGKVNEIPIYWKVEERDNSDILAYDVLEIEEKFWKKREASVLTSDLIDEDSSIHKKKLCISPIQKEGLLYQQKISCGATKQSIYKEGISLDLYGLLNKNNKSYVSPSSITSILNTRLFLFEKIMKVAPLFSEWEYSMKESLVWGILYHNLLELGLEDKFNNTGFIEGLGNEKNILSLLLNSGVHPYLWDIIKLHISEFQLEEHISHLYEYLTQKGSVLFKSEETMQMNMNTFVEGTRVLGQDILAQIFIRGRADVVHKNDQGEYHIIDFKRKSGDLNIANMFQAWMYYILSNKLFSEYKDFQKNIYNQKQNEYSALLYFVFESDNLRFYPLEEDIKKKDSIHKKLILFEELCKVACKNIAEGNFFKNIDEINFEVEELKSLYEELMLSPSLEQKLILREGSYAFRR